ncbi:hypothetical protein [Rhizobium hidalgonense]|uniref:hypothetical protein n=1 Tax=Rhizobium hidalgonense TaxID=1538159 RepID=UPI0011063C67|nr:hypothetical protein [Rhizobium hidalgonense]MDR9805694.1 hypothetical protein [Rhizobium hidalgonense]
MTNSAVVSERKFAAVLEGMSDEELFELMAELEIRSPTFASCSPANEDFAKIVLVESAIERRFPGQMLKPYKAWQLRLMHRDCA